VDHLLGREVAPPPLEVALVLDLVEDDRLAVGVPVQNGPAEVGDRRPVLDAGVGYAWVGLVEQLGAVVDRPQMPVRVGVGHDLEESLPVGVGLGLHEVELVGQRPPDVPVGGQPGDDVPQVTVVGRRRHPVEPPVPFVVGVEQDQVGLDAEIAELADPLLQVAEEGGVEPGEVPLVRRGAGERVSGWLGLVEGVPLREDAHPQLVERPGLQGSECLFFELVALVGPGVAGGADREVRGAVGVLEVEGVPHPDRAAVAGRRLRHLDRAGLAGQFRAVALRGVGPRSRARRHEPHPVGAVAVVEAGGADGPVALGEGGGHLDVGERVAVDRTGQGQLEGAPLLDAGGTAGGHGPGDEKAGEDETHGGVLPGEG
jgi:hypothetical protein